MSKLKNLFGKRIGTLLTTVLVVSLVYGGVALADIIIQGGQNTINISENGQDFEDEFTFSAFVTRDTGLDAGFNSISISDTLRFGPNTDEGRNYHFKHIDFAVASTTLVSEQNLFGETQYVCDGGVDIFMSGVATGTIEFLVGTSSTVFVDNDNVCGTTDACGNATAGEASILLSGDVISGITATSTLFNKEDFQGTDTRDGSGERHCVPILSLEYLTVYASSSSDVFFNIVNSTNLLDGYVQLTTFTLDN